MMNKLLGAGQNIFLFKIMQEEFFYNIKIKLKHCE